jgi:hypothetical protein
MRESLWKVWPDQGHAGGVSPLGLTEMEHSSGCLVFYGNGSEHVVQTGFFLMRTRV